MINLIRSWFCKHDFQKHVDNTPSTRVYSDRDAGVSHSYSVYAAYIYCTKCGKVKELN
jgi:hypothetical protein